MKIPEGKTVYIHGKKFKGNIPDELVDDELKKTLSQDKKIENKRDVKTTDGFPASKDRS